MNLESGFTGTGKVFFERAYSPGSSPAANATPAPATMAILAFGGLAVLRKRRKQ